VDGWCFFHLPGNEEAVHEARARGGRNRSNAIRAQRRVARLGITDTQDILSIAAHDLLSGEMEPGVANALANICKALITATQYGTMAEQLAELERQAERVKQERLGRDHG
jgi:hypothetical protein